LEALKNAMDTAAEESTKLLNELEAKLAMVREELRFERTRYKDLNMKFKALKMLVEREGGDMGALLLEENESLRTSVISLQKETKQLQSELEKKTIKIEKSEKRVTAKHEQARQLNEANASLRDGIQKLKDHLSTISEQASKTEATLATTKDEVDKEREKAMKLEVANETLQTKVAVFRESIGGSSDQATSKTIELTASLAAINKELSLERERARKLMDAKRELQVTFDTTRENLQTQLHTHTTKNSEFETQILSLEEELQGTKNLAAASNKKLEELNESKSKEFAKLQGVLESTRELLTAEKSKAEGMKTLKTTMESKLDTMKQRVEVLQSSNDCLKEELEAMKRKASTNASESSHQFTELEKLLATTQEELNEEEQQVESLEKQVDDLTMQIQELEKCKSDLEASLDDVKQEMETVNAKNAELLVKLKSAGEDNDSDEIPSVPSKNAASQDVRLWEAEMLLGNTKRELKDALKQNEELTGKVNNLESSLEKSQETNAQTLAESETHVQVNKEMAELIDSLQTQLKSLNEENQSLMKRTAALARRDQIQKASLTTSNGEIETLMTTMSDFQKRFETLAAQVEQVESEKNAQMKDFEEQEAKWIAERTGLNDLIAKLQKKCEEMKAKYEAVDAKHVRALMKEQSAWQTERVALNSRIAHFEKSDSFTKPDSAVSYPPLQTCNTDRSMLNQKVSELEQDMQLLEVTMEDKKQQHLVATAELEVAKYKLKEAEEELQSCRSEIQLLVLRSVTDREDFNGQVRELQEDLESMKDAVEAAKKERNANEANYESCLEELNLCKDDLKSLKTATDAELKSAIEQYEELESKYDTCVKELASCQAEMKEKEEVMRELAKKQVEQRDDQEKHARSSKALELLTDELNDAHIREKELEDVLSSCKKELTSCKKKLKSIQVDDAPDDERGGDSYKDVIANLNRSNNSLIVTNQKLKDEIESLRVVAEGNNVNTSNASSLTAGTSDEVERENLMMKDLLATSQNSVSESKNIQKRLLKQIEAASKRETKLTKEILALKARNEENEKRLEEQEQELDEFESDFALARSDARKVVDKLRKQLSQLEKRNKLLESSSGGQDAIDDLRNKLKALVQRNKRLEKEISVCKTREQRLQSQLDLESRRCR
jgi:chromosome segregation ATPase